MSLLRNRAHFRRSPFRGARNRRVAFGGTAGDRPGMRELGRGDPPRVDSRESSRTRCISQSGWPLAGQTIPGAVLPAEADLCESPLDLLDVADGDRAVD